MNTDINNYIVRKHNKEWQPLIENEIRYTGISVISLKYDEDKKRSTTILLKFEAGQHTHITITPEVKKFLY